MPKGVYYSLLNRTTVEKRKPIPPHRITGINAYLPPCKVVDEWARVQELRKENDLVKGGRRVRSAHFMPVINGQPFSKYS